MLSTDFFKPQEKPNGKISYGFDGFNKRRMMCFGHVANYSESIKETVKKSKGAPFFNTSDLSVNVVKSGYYGKCDTIFGMSKSVG